MKKLLLTISAIALFFSGVQAQTAPDFGFESWAAIAAPFIPAQDPAGWASLNALTAVGTALSVTKETTGPAAGTASAKISTVYITGATIPNPYGGNFDTAGILCVGKIIPSPPSFKYGFGLYANRPATLTFKSKYTPVGADSGFVLAYITHYNTTLMKRDTLGSGKYAIGASTTSYAINNITMNYKASLMSVQADSEQIFISSSIYSHNGARIGSAFYIDSLAWSGYVGIDEINGVENSVSVYPNPASNSIAIKCSVSAKNVEVIDITGRKIASYLMTNNEASIETTNFTPGLYLFNVIDKDKKIINRGKFEVAH